MVVYLRIDLFLRVHVEICHLRDRRGDPKYMTPCTYQIREVTVFFLSIRSPFFRDLYHSLVFRLAVYVLFIDVKSLIRGATPS